MKRSRSRGPRWLLLGLLLISESRFFPKKHLLGVLDSDRADRLCGSQWPGVAAGVVSLRVALRLHWGDPTGPLPSGCGWGWSPVGIGVVVALRLPWGIAAGVAWRRRNALLLGVSIGVIDEL